MDPNQSLLRWGIENSDKDTLNEQAKSPTVKKFDPELVEFILGKDDAVRIKETLLAIEDINRPREERLAACGILLDLVETIDNANNVAKMGLWERILSFLDSEDSEMVVKILWIASTCCQNNPEASNVLLKFDIVKKALAILDSTSSALETSDMAFDQFASQNGPKSFEDLLKGHEEDANLRERVVFVLNFHVILIGSVPAHLKNNIFLFNLFTQYHNESHEDCTCELH